MDIVTIPQKSTPELAEFIGVLIGDGHMYNTGNRYVIGITGNLNLEEDYYLYLKKLIKNVWGKDVKIKKYKYKVFIVFSSKSIFKFLTSSMGLVSGNSCYKKFIPEVITKDWDLVKHTIRGIVDTDGSIFVANKPGSPNYPSIEITTTSPILAFKIKEILTDKGFRVAKIWTYCSKKSKLTTYKVPLNGYKNLELWMQEIGFSNNYKAVKAKEILKRKMGQGGFEPPIVEGQITS